MAQRAETVADLLPKFYRRCVSDDLPRGTLVGWRGYLGRFSAYVGDTPASTISVAQVDDFIVDTYGGLSHASKRGALVALRAFFRWAHQRDHVPANPAEHVRLRRARPRERPTYYRPEEAARLLAAFVDPQDRLIAVLLLRHGQRVNSTLSLRWRNVDLDRAVIRYEPQKLQRRGLTLPLDVDTGRMLKAWKAISIDPSPDGWVFASTSHPGHHRYDDGFRDSLRAACRRAGVQYRGAHELRRTCATTLLQQGEPLHVVSRGVLGHSSVQTTITHYAGSDDEDIGMMLRRLPF